MKRANFLNFTLKAIDWETTLGSEVKWMAGVGGVRFAPLCLAVLSQEAIIVGIVFAFDSVKR